MQLLTDLNKLNEVLSKMKNTEENEETDKSEDIEVEVKVFENYTNYHIGTQEIAELIDRASEDLDKNKRIIYMHGEHGLLRPVSVEKGIDDVYVVDYVIPKV